MKKIFCLLFILFPFFTSIKVVAQDKGVYKQMDKHELNLERKVDSLKGLVFDDKYKEIKNNSDIMRIYADLNLDSALVYANKEILLAGQIGDPDGVANARISSSTILYQMGKYESAINLLLDNRRERDKINDTLMARTESGLSNMFIITEEFDKSIKATHAAIKTFEQLKDSNNVGFSYISLAEVYSLALGNNKDAIVYIKKSITFLNAKDATKEYLIAALITYGDLSVLEGDYEIALITYLEAEQIAVNNNEYWYFQNILTCLGKVYYFKKEHEKSISYLEKSMSRDAGNVTNQSLGYKYLAQNYKDMGKPKKAIPYFNLCLQIEQRHDLVNSYRVQLVACYVQISEYKKAFEIQEQIIVSRDSINELKQKEKVTEIVEKYENDKKQQEINTLSIEKELQDNQIEQQQIVLFGIIAFFLLLIGIGFYWYKARIKLRETTQNLEKTQLQQRFLRTQLNPHFFFHALTSIESYIYSNDKIKAAGFLQSFSKLMRNILESSDVDFVPLQNDIDFIEKYIELQQLSNSFQFNYQINISPNLNAQDILVPPMLIQPFVENAILHGALSREDGLVEIDYAKNGNQVEITITDNGEGESQISKSSSKLHRSMSGGITEERIKILKETHGMEISYQPIYSTENNIGKSVVFNIPLGFK